MTQLRQHATPWTSSQLKVVSMIQDAAARTGADASWLVADAEVESNLNLNAAGDYVNGKPTSYGPFQDHQGGALGKHSPAWAQGAGGILDAAKRFVGVKSGAGAAATQRPKDQAAYAAKVNAAHATLPAPYKWSPLRPIVATMALGHGLTHTSGNRPESVGAAVGAPNDWHSSSRSDVWADDYSGGAAEMQSFYQAVHARYPQLQVLPNGHPQSTGPNVHVGGVSSWTAAGGAVSPAGAAAIAAGNTAASSTSGNTASPGATATNVVNIPGVGSVGGALTTFEHGLLEITFILLLGGAGLSLVIMGIAHATGNDQKFGMAAGAKLLAKVPEAAAVAA